MTTTEVHEAGAARHGDRWLHANQRAVEELWNTRLRVDLPEVKEAMPRVVLRLLDYMMIQTGHKWNPQSGLWDKHPTPHSR